MHNHILISALCLTFAVSGFSQAIEVTTTGVGIGTNVPVAKLHVIGPIRADWDSSSSKIPLLELRRLSSGVYNGSSLYLDVGMGTNLANMVAGAKLNTTGTGYEYAGSRGASRVAFGDGVVQFYTSNQVAGVANAPVLWSSGNAASMTINELGCVGIGTATPSARLTVTNNDDAKIKIYSNGGSIGVIDTVANTAETTGRWLTLNPTGGNVGIGTYSLSHKLTVNGQVKSKGFITDTSNWSDYVFRKDYKLPTLIEVEQHIAEKGHLPGIPSEKEVLANGVNLGDMQVKLLAQIEQLTLHMIAHQKAIDALQQENASLKRELKAVAKPE